MASKQVTVEWLSTYENWEVRTRGLQGARDSYPDTKKEAERRGKNVAKRYNAKLVVEKKNGVTEYTRDYSNGSSGGRGGQSGGGGLFGGNGLL